MPIPMTTICIGISPNGIIKEGLLIKAVSNFKTTLDHDMRKLPSTLPAISNEEIANFISIKIDCVGCQFSYVIGDKKQILQDSNDAILKNYMKSAQDRLENAIKGFVYKDTSAKDKNLGIAIAAAGPKWLEDLDIPNTLISILWGDED